MDIDENNGMFEDSNLGSKPSGSGMEQNDPFSSLIMKKTQLIQEKGLQNFSILVAQIIL